jgi:ribulose 1,5-bisphosphate synthetase/thiazole synthase
LIFRWWRRRRRRAEKLSADVDGEDNRICHQVRDGKFFTRPPASARHDVVIVGGGVSGLTAAYRLRQARFSSAGKRTALGRQCLLDGV